jgi:hypothetical protein
MTPVGGTSSRQRNYLEIVGCEIGDPALQDAPINIARPDTDAPILLEVDLPEYRPFERHEY